MRVTTNTFPDNLISNLERLTARMTKLQQQTATGQRITNPSDDPAAAVRVLNFQTEQSKIAQFHRNALRADDILNATINEIRNIFSVSERANEIIALSSEVQGTGALNVYGIEVNEMLEQALVNANSNFNGDPLFGGTGANLRPFTAVRDVEGNITSVTFDGSVDTAEFQIAEGSRISPFSSDATNQDILGFLNNLVSLRDSLSSGDVTAIKAQAVPLQASEDNLINAISAQGALQQRIELETAQNRSRYSDLAGQISREADVDLAQTIVSLTQNQNAYQAALMSAGQILNTSLLDYI